MFQDKHMANEAADLSINCYLKDFPPSITIKDKTRAGEWKDRELNLVYFPNYESLGCEPYKDIFYYFQWLKDHPKEDSQEQNDEDWDDDDGSQNQGSNHYFSEDNSRQELTDNQIKMANKHLESIMESVKNDVMKSVGKVPAELSDIFDMFGKIEPEKFNWKSYLRLFCAKSKAIWYKKTKRKESKRFPGNAGTKTKHYCKVAVMPDTSGSVSDDELTEFISEFIAMRRQHNDINIICFDAKVYEPVKLTSNYKVPIFGKGGTDFKEAVDWIWENYKDYDCFIIFTDGYDTVPSKLPSNLLWVLSSKTDLTPEKFKAKNCIKLEL